MVQLTQSQIGWSIVIPVTIICSHEECMIWYQIVSVRNWSFRLFLVLVEPKNIQIFIMTHFMVILLFAEPWTKLFLIVLIHSGSVKRYELIFLCSNELHHL